MMLKEETYRVNVTVLVTTISSSHAEELAGKMMHGEVPMSKYWSIQSIEEV